MKILVLSDTHGSLDRLNEVLRQSGSIDAVIHLGDNTSDAKKIAGRTHLPVYNVRGNCDFDPETPSEAVFTFDGVKILCCHGHLMDVDAQYYRAQELGAKAALSGHTHIPYIDYDGKVLLLNPGSLSRPRGGSRPGYAVLTIEGGRVDGQLFSV